MEGGRVASRIASIEAREIIAGRGNVGLQVRVTTEAGAVGVATPEVGVSTGEHEAEMVLDGEERYSGMGVRKAAQNVRDVAPNLLGIQVNRQREIDLRLCGIDGTQTKSNLGANAIVGISIACAKAAANDAGLPLYQYIGGAHACVMAMPIIGIGQGGRYREPGTSRWFKPSYEFTCIGAGSIEHALEMNHVLRKRFGAILVERYGDDVRSYGGYHLSGVLKDDRELLDAMTEAIARSGYEGDVGIYYDAASGCYYEADIDRYVGIFCEGEKTRDQMIETYLDHINNYPVYSIEDPMHENDFEGHAIATKELGIEIVGDDLFTTNIERLQMGIQSGAANSMVLKITQVGTVSEALQACEVARSNGYNVHPCGSRGDRDSIGDFAVALNAGQARAVDLNRLLTIEQELGPASVWPGWAAINGVRHQARAQ